MSVGSFGSAGRARPQPSGLPVPRLWEQYEARAFGRVVVPTRHRAIPQLPLLVVAPAHHSPLDRQAACSDAVSWTMP